MGICMVSYIHHYGIIQNGFTTVKYPLCFIYSILLPIESLLISANVFYGSIVLPYLECPINRII